MNDGEARNMGHASHADHDGRYDRADEFMEVVLRPLGFLGRRRDRADKQTGLFAHPDKVQRLEYQGEFFARAARSPCRARRRAIR